MSAPHPDLRALALERLASLPPAPQPADVCGMEVRALTFWDGRAELDDLSLCEYRSVIKALDDWAAASNLNAGYSLQMASSFSQANALGPDACRVVEKVVAHRLKNPWGSLAGPLLKRKREFAAMDDASARMVMGVSDPAAGSSVSASQSFSSSPPTGPPAMTGLMASPPSLAMPTTADPLRAARMSLPPSLKQQNPAQPVRFKKEITEETSRNYRTYLDKFSRWRNDRGLQPIWPPSDAELMAYMQFLQESKLTTNSIRNYLGAIRFKARNLFFGT
jgi:hypothetical protein